MNNKWLIPVLFVILFCIGFTGAMLYQRLNKVEPVLSVTPSAAPSIQNDSPSVEPTVELVENPEGVDQILTDTGWYELEVITLPNGEQIDTNGITKLQVLYSPTQQPYFRQEYGPQGPAFASMNVEVVNDTLVITAHVEPQKLAAEPTQADRNFWITSMVIQALHKLSHPESTPEELIELDQAMFVKHKHTVMYKVALE